MDLRELKYNPQNRVNRSDYCRVHTHHAIKHVLHQFSNLLLGFLVLNLVFD